MEILISIAAFVCALAVLIVVHEFGHYSVARACGVKVLRFSFGFGKVLASVRAGRDQTEWALSVFPLGGYVKMLDEREGEVAPHELSRAFNRQSVARRCLIVLAGPVANFLLAIVLYWVVFMYGVPGIKPIVGDIVPNSPAAAAQMVTGETIVKIAEQPVSNWQDARWLLLKQAINHSVVKLELQNDHHEISWHMLDLSQLKVSDIDGDFLRKVGFLRFQPPLPPVIGQVIGNGAAERSGLQEGDRIIAINDTIVNGWDGIVNVVSASAGQQLKFQIERGDHRLELEIVPDVVADERGNQIGRIGIAPRVDRGVMEKYLVEVSYPPAESLVRALDRTWDTSLFSLRMMGKMLIGEISLKNLSGPITIADYAGQSAQVGGVSYLVFLAMISISLGVLNLLPVPLLDGGHLMYYMLEIFKGSPVSEKAMQFGQQVGVTLLFILMAFALYNDINRLILRG
jgi:regulator of sigma E protease